MRKIFNILLLITILVTINSVSSKKDMNFNTNINNQHNTIVEFYEYINYFTKTIPEIYITNKNKEKIINELAYITTQYTSEFSNIKFTPLKQDSVEINTLLGKYIFNFNPQTINLMHLDGDNRVTRPTFSCEISIYLTEISLANQIPDCNYNQNKEFNSKFNEKIKESIILAKINSLLFSYKNLPIILPEKNDLIKSLTIPNEKQADIIKEINVTNLSDEEHEKSKIHTKIANTEKNIYERFKIENKIINMKIDVKTVVNYNPYLIESCVVELYQPWYLLLPNTLYTSVSYCTVIE